MKIKYSKPIDPTQFQKGILSDLKTYTKKMAARSLKYSKKADIRVDSCYVCGKSTFSKPFLNVHGFQYVRCLNCTHVFCTKRLPQTALNEFYTTSNEYSSSYTSKEQIAYRLKNIAKPKVDFAMENILFRKKGGRWLDVGSAIGDIVKSVESHPNWKSTGLEISSDSVKTGKRIFKIDLRQQLFKDFANENPSEKFDVISFFGYFEVISDPMVELKIARKMLKKGGYIVIGEANADSFSTQVQKSYPQLSRRHLLPPTVIQQFTKKSMTIFLRAIKVKPVAFWDFGMDFYEFVCHLCVLVPGLQNTPIAEFLMQNLNGFQEIIDKKEMGDNFVIVAK